MGRVGQQGVYQPVSGGGAVGLAANTLYEESGEGGCFGSERGWVYEGKMMNNTGYCEAAL